MSLFLAFAHLVAREIALSSRAIIAGEMKTFFGTNHEKSSGAGQKVYIVYLTAQDRLDIDVRKGVLGGLTPPLRLKI